MRTELEISISKHKKEFLEKIKIMCQERAGFENSYSGSSTDYSLFPIFETEDAGFLQNRFQKRILEEELRKLINRVLNDLFDIHGFSVSGKVNSRSKKDDVNAEDIKEIHWYGNAGPCECDGSRIIRSPFNPIEFIIFFKKKAYAFRYYHDEEIYPKNDDLFHFYNYEDIKQMDETYNSLWNNMLNVQFDFYCDKDIHTLIDLEDVEKGKTIIIDWSGLNENKPFNKTDFSFTITIETFFNRFFSSDEYVIFIKEIRKAVKQANAILESQIIDRLMPANYQYFKHQVFSNYLFEKKTIEDNTGIKIEERKFRIYDGKDGKEVPIVFSKEEKEKMKKIFSRHFLSLLGDQKFAVSFLTAEYLYRIIKDDIKIEYTAIVTGYFKAVEQLCETIIYDFYVKKPDERLFFLAKKLNKDSIKRDMFTTPIFPQKAEFPDIKGMVSKAYAKMGKRVYVKMGKNNEKYYSGYHDGTLDRELTMLQMFCFFYANLDSVITIGKDSFEKVFTWMNYYASNDRNGFFHKDNILDYKEVQRIRNNTFVILYWLLSLIRISDSEEEDKRILGTYNLNSFEILFKKLQYNYLYAKFILVYDDGIELKAIRVKSQKQYSFDKYGHLVNAELLFGLVEEFPYEGDEINGQNWNYEDDYEKLASSIPKSKITIINSIETMPKQLFYLDRDDKKVLIPYETSIDYTHFP